MKMRTVSAAILAVVTALLIGWTAPANAYQPPAETTYRPQIDGPWKATFTPTQVQPGGYMNDHTVFQAPDGRWHIIGISGGGSGHETSFAHAVADSLDGPWTELPPLAAYTDDTGRALAAWAPSALVRDGVTYLFYRSDLNGGNPTLALDTSTDPNLEVWQRHLEVTLTGLPSSEDHFRDPMVVQDGSIYRMYFTASWNGRSSIGMATSSDLIHWAYQGAALTTSGSAADVSWSAGESPFVFKYGDSWYLSTTLTTSSDADYHQTFVFRSSDPSWFGDFNGDPATTPGADVVAQLPVHAPEYVDDHGQWYITTCGWAGKSLYPEAKTGVAIAPLRFDKIAAGSAPASTVPSTDGLVADYPFEDSAAGRSTTVADASGNGHTAELVGSAQEVGQRAGSTVVTVSPTAAGAVQLPKMTFTGDFTMAAWMDPSTTVDNKQGLFTLGTGIDINAYQGKLRFHGGGKDWAIAPFTLPQNQWTHVAVTRTDGMISMYMNGSLVASGGPFTAAVTPGQLGVPQAGHSAASYDDLMLYNRALTGQEIATAMGTATTATPTPTPSPTPTVTPTPSGTPTPQPTTTPTGAVIPANGGSTGTLPTTGMPGIAWAVLAVVVLAVGAGGLLVRRRP